MKEIHLHNFRCFTEQDVLFKSGVNLLIGDNASGKTSLLKACKYVLSAFFSGFSDENTRWTGFESADFQQQVINGIALPEQPVRIDFNISDTFGNINSDILFENEYCLVKKKPHGCRMLKEGLKGYTALAASLQNGLYDRSRGSQVLPLPLFACFSTEDIHSRRKLDVARFKNYTPKNSFGYYECLDGNGFLDYWHRRLLVLQEAGHYMQEVDIVRQAIATALGPEGCNIIKDIDIRPNKKAVYYIFCDGREVEDDKLPDGYRRIVNIVVDLAFRCALLNRGIYATEACARTKGTVLIDEIDMHLHPSLQSVVLKSLRQTFPQLQFIVTSHAPMVMSSVENNETNVVYKINYTGDGCYSIITINTYGQDMSTIAGVALGVLPRDRHVDEQLKELFTLIDNDDFAEAKNLLQSMQQQFGSNLPELSKAETMLSLYE